jgi:hypothetical protein
VRKKRLEYKRIATETGVQRSGVGYRNTTTPPIPGNRPSASSAQNNPRSLVRCAKSFGRRKSAIVNSLGGQQDCRALHAIGLLRSASNES